MDKSNKTKDRNLNKGARPSSTSQEPLSDGWKRHETIPSVDFEPYSNIPRRFSSC